MMIIAMTFEDLHPIYRVDVTLKRLSDAFANTNNVAPFY